MRLPNWLLPANIPPLEMLLIIVFVVFLAAPAPIPGFIAEWIDSPIGITVVAIAAFYMFFTSTPVLAVLSLIAAYEILRRSAENAGRYTLSSGGRGIATQKTRTAEMQNDNLLSSRGATGAGSLEEEIVNRNVPVGFRPPNHGKPFETIFKPILSSDHGEATTI